MEPNEGAEPREEETGKMDLEAWNSACFLGLKQLSCFWGFLLCTSFWCRVLGGALINGL